MAPSAVLSKFRYNRRDSNSSSLSHSAGPAVSVPLQFPGLATEGDRPPPSQANAGLSSGLSTTNLYERLKRQSSDYNITALPQFLDDPSRASSDPAALEGRRSYTKTFSASDVPEPGSSASSTPASRKTTAPLSDAGTHFLSHGSGRVSPAVELPHQGNLSNSWSSLGEDAPPNKSAFSRPGRGKLHLLNPRSLLARRRLSHHPIRKFEDTTLNVKSSVVPALPLDYDPRIRGSFVHDFSVPKADRTLHVSNDRSSPEILPSPSSRPSTRGTDKGVAESSSPLPQVSYVPPFATRSPVFKEHFDDSRQPLPQSTGYLHSLAANTAMRTSAEPPRLPAFAKSLPLDIFGSFDKVQEERSSQKACSAATSCTSEPISSPAPQVQQDAFADPTFDPPAPEHGKKQQTSPDTETLGPTESLPRHMSSTSSRFSFQLGGTGSERQERLLEEKHREQVASKLAAKSYENDCRSEGSDWMDAGYDDGEGLEEKIPGVNADSDEEAIEPFQEKLVGSDHLTPIDTDLSLISLMAANSQLTTLDNNGSVIDLACPNIDSKIARSGFGSEPSLTMNSPPTLTSDLSIPSLGSFVSIDYSGVGERSLPHTLDGPQENIDGISCDRRYEYQTVGPFRASSIGQLSGMSFWSPWQPESTEAAQVGELSVNGNSLDDKDPTGTGDPMLDEVLIDLIEDKALIAERLDRGDNPCHGLTEHNLAYQNAMVIAANKATHPARLSPRSSKSYSSEDLNSGQPFAGSHSGFMSENIRFSGLPDDSKYAPNSDQFPLDDTLDDDPMIAEANAEVLEHDYEGFYGQEFGFFARAHGKGDSQMVNGGFFGPRQIEAMHRSYSAKDKFQEPSLTPITERSEWSRRNSMASVHTLVFPQTTQAGGSPRLTQLYDSPIQEDDLLVALLRLRREAWGGSQTSLSSTTGSQTGSFPFSQYPVRDCFGSQSFSFDNGHSASSPIPVPPQDYAVISSPAAASEPHHSLGLTSERHATPNGIMDETRLSGLDSRTVLSSSSHAPQTSISSAKGHAREGSRADSFSYTKDPEDSQRWLLERKRTDEDGKEKVVGREYVAEARI